MNKTIYTKAYKLVVKKLVIARKSAGLKQSEVANKLKCTQSYVSKSETGQLRLDIIQLKEFAEIYKKDIKYFIED